MPIFFQQDIDDCTRLGVWKIEEEEDFFLEKVIPQRNVSHPHKKLQHLAGRYLLKYLFPEFPIELIQVADTRKPFLEDEAFHFSISHCGNYAAVIVSTTNRVGVDAELISDKPFKIKHKFISLEEEQVVDSSGFHLNTADVVNEEWLTMKSIIAKGKHGTTITDLKPIANNHLQITNTFCTLIWSCKEAVFKWYGLGGVDFREHMKIRSVFPVNGDKYNTIMLFKKNEDLYLDLHSYLFNDLCLSYVVT
jgi:4'-phosphopantetheinyl transferase EntD